MSGDRKQDYEDRLSDLVDRQSELEALAEEKHARDTRAEYRSEHGEEMDDYEPGNLGEQASLDAFDEEDAADAEVIDDSLRAAKGSVAAIGDETPPGDLAALTAALDEVEGLIAERERKLGRDEEQG